MNIYDYFFKRYFQHLKLVKFNIKYIVFFESQFLFYILTLKNVHGLTRKWTIL